MSFNFRLQDLRQSKLERRDVHDQTTIELSQGTSEQSLFGDSNANQMENVRIHEEMTRRIQVDDSNDANEDELSYEDEPNLFRVNMGKMKSVYTMLNVILVYSLLNLCDFS